MAALVVTTSSIAAIVAVRYGRSMERRMAAVSRRDESIEIVLAAVQCLWAHRSPAELLVPVADAARLLSGAHSATVYLPDPEDSAWLTRVALLPHDAGSAGPACLPAAFAANGVARHEDDSWLVPATHGDSAPAGLIVLSGVPQPVGADSRAMLAVLGAHASYALGNARRLAHILAQASEDGLTGLLNHRAFQTRLEGEVARAERTKRPLSVMMIDLDNFGSINNSYGHQVGDMALVAVSIAVRQSLRVPDVAARYGGDELAVILPETSIDEAIAVAHRTRAAITALSAVELGAPIHIDASIGVAALPLHAATREELVRAADQAAYAAKRAGKGRVGRPEDADITWVGDPGSIASQLANANMAAVEALAAAVDAKDPYTRGHAQRVSVYAAALAEALGLPASDVDRVRLAGLLHDVGKIGVPDAILAKPGQLDDAELGALQEHPVIGERMLAAVPFLKSIVPAVRHHHERWDGRGYPDGLAGTAIPPDAAILMVADSFDAMTTSRPYRPALPVGEACRRVREGRGAQFDPRVAEAFERAYTSGKLTPLSSGGTKILSEYQRPAQPPRASARLDRPVAAGAAMVEQQAS